MQKFQEGQCELKRNRSLHVKCQLCQLRFENVGSGLTSGLADSSFSKTRQVILFTSGASPLQTFRHDHGPSFAFFAVSAPSCRVPEDFPVSHEERQHTRDLDMNAMRDRFDDARRAKAADVDNGHACGTQPGRMVIPDRGHALYIDTRV